MGLLDTAQPAAPAQAPNSPMVQTADVDAKMKDMQRLVVAGKKVLYDETTREKTLAGLEPTPESIGQTVMGVMGVVMSQVGPDKAKPDLIIPAGVMLVGDLLDFAAEAADVEVTEELGKACIVAFAQAMMDQTGGQQAPTPEAAPMPPAAPAAPQPQAMGV